MSIKFHINFREQDLEYDDCGGDDYYDATSGRSLGDLYGYNPYLNVKDDVDDLPLTPVTNLDYASLRQKAINDASDDFATLFRDFPGEQRASLPPPPQLITDEGPVPSVVYPGKKNREKFVNMTKKEKN